MDILHEQFLIKFSHQNALNVSKLTIPSSNPKATSNQYARQSKKLKKNPRSRREVTLSVLLASNNNYS